jgi:hypothetical protein
MRFHALFLLVAIFACCSEGDGRHTKYPQQATRPRPDPENPYRQIGEIPEPEGYTRATTAPGTFGYWLRHAPLKKDQTVYLYNGQRKPNQSAQFAVLDISVGKQDLQQCADAVMRLRAEYLYDQGAYDKIIFWDNEGRAYPFMPPYTRERFNQYLVRVFGWCGSASLEKQLFPQSWAALQPGDVLIRGGFPGHAVIVMDVAQNDKGEKQYLLAQSYMPAQNIHLLRNPVDEQASPWYRCDSTMDVVTPEWVFGAGALRRW